MKHYYWIVYLFIIFLLNACSKHPTCDTFDCVRQHSNDSLFLIGTYIHIPQELGLQHFLRLSDGFDLEITMFNWVLLPQFIEGNDGLEARITGVVYLTDGGNLVHFEAKGIEWLEPFF